MVAEGDALRPPFTPELLADLHGDVLSPEQASRLWEAASADPAARDTLAALDRVRAELGALRADQSTPPPIPPDVLARIRGALESEPPRVAESGASVSELPARRRNPVRVAAAVAAAFVVFAIAGVTLLRPSAEEPHRSADAPTGAVLADPATVQLGDDLGAAAALTVLGNTDLGSLSDPARLSECLRANGIDADTQLLGSGPVQLRGIAGTLLLTAGPQAPKITALVVGSTCSTNDPATLARADIG
ncbi:hypothetical protein ACFYVR_15670 [Rhodococcus sp. NPDC003318]|uniref:hypothetical protein n=1 Tax=Rhodococcus sp. NPDC003318 TaxID=3364503 RepID=UPI003684EEED